MCQHQEVPPRSHRPYVPATEAWNDVVFALTNGAHNGNRDGDWIAGSRHLDGDQGDFLQQLWPQSNNTAPQQNYNPGVTGHNNPLSGSMVNRAGRAQQTVGPGSAGQGVAGVVNAADDASLTAQPAGDTTDLTCKLHRVPVRFKTRGEKTRHDRTVHADQHYFCKCSHSTARKDNYTRHLKNFCSQTNNPQLWYTCICGNDFFNLNEHLDHVINECNKRRPGPARMVN